MWPAAFFRLRRRIVRVRIALWWSSVDARLHRVRDPTIPAVLSPPIKLASSRPRGRLDWDRCIDFSAICFGTLLDLIVGEIHI